MDKQHTGDRLKTIMKSRGLKQVDILRLAEPYIRQYGVNVSKQDISHYINKRGEPNSHKLVILGKALGVSEAWLMGLDVPMERKTVDEFHEMTPDERYEFFTEEVITCPYVQRTSLIIHELERPRKEKVENYAQKQLEEQKQEATGNVHQLETAIEFHHEDSIKLDFVKGGAVAGLGNYHDDFELDKIQIPESQVPYGTDFCILVDGDSMSPTYPNRSIAFVEYTANIKHGEIGIFKQGSDVWIKEAGQGKLISHNKNYPDITINEYDEPVMVIGRVLGYYIES